MHVTLVLGSVALAVLVAAPAAAAEEEEIFEEIAVAAVQIASSVWIVAAAVCTFLVVASYCLVPPEASCAKLAVQVYAVLQAMDVVVCYVLGGRSEVLGSVQ